MLVDVSGRVAVIWSAVVGSEVGVLVLIAGNAVAVGLNVDNWAGYGVSPCVGGDSSWVQPSKTRMVKAAMVQSVISGLNWRGCFIF